MVTGSVNYRGQSILFLTLDGFHICRPTGFSQSKNCTSSNDIGRRLNNNTSRSPSVKYGSPPRLRWGSSGDTAGMPLAHPIFCSPWENSMSSPKLLRTSSISASIKTRFNGSLSTRPSWLVLFICDSNHLLI